MFDEFQKSIIRNINKSKSIEFAELLNQVLVGVIIIYNLPNKKNEQTILLNNIDEKDQKISDLLTAVSTIADLEQDKYIRTIDKDMLQTSTINIGKLADHREKEETKYKNIELFEWLAHFVNKKILSTIKLERLQQNDFHDDPSIRFYKQIRYQLLAIGITALIGALTLTATIISIVKTPTINFNLNNSTALTEILNELKESNNNRVILSDKTDNIRLEIDKLIKQLESNTDSNNKVYLQLGKEVIKTLEKRK